MRLLNRRVADIVLLGVILVAFAGSASAQTLYQNGSINGQVSGWTLNSGYGVADSFILAGSSTLGGEWWVPFSGCQGLRRVFSNPNRATAFDTQGSQPYGLLHLKGTR